MAPGDLRILISLPAAILADRSLVPTRIAAAYVAGEVVDVEAALEGARDIVAETVAENAELPGRLRAHLQERAVLRSKLSEGKQESGAKFSDCFDHRERWTTVPSHRALAMLRGATRKFFCSISRSMPRTRPRSSRWSA